MRVLWTFCLDVDIQPTKNECCKLMVPDIVKIFQKMPTSRLEHKVLDYNYWM